MKILFCPAACIPFHAATLEERPLGGTETGIIRLSQALSERGHEVYVLTQFQNPPQSVPHYLPFDKVGTVGSVDVFVSVREWFPLLSPIKASRRVFWSGDSYDQPHNLGMGDVRLIKVIDKFLAVSKWQAEMLCHHSGFPIEKTSVIGNGVHLSYFDGEELRNPKRLIYSSTPYRGLDLLPQIFSYISKQHSDAELHIFSGYAVYSGPHGYDSRAEQEFNKLADHLRKIPKCFVHGNKKQRELAREFMRSAILAYPNTFEETSCITVMEALAGGCVPVTSRRGALSETVGECGVLIDGEPSSDAYIRAFSTAVSDLLSDHDRLARFSKAGMARAREDFGWEMVAKRFEQVALV